MTICSNSLMSSITKDTWTISRCVKPSQSSRIVSQKLRRTLTGKIKWLMSGTKLVKQEIMMKEQLLEKMRIWKLVVLSVTTHPRPLLLRRACDHKYLRQFRKKAKINQNGIPHSRVTRTLQRIALQEDLPTKCFVIMRSSVASTRPAQSKNSLKKKPKNSSSLTMATRALLSA